MAVEAVAAPVPMDEDDASVGDPQRCSQYARSIYAYLKEREAKYLLPADYMQSQRDINSNMRSILVDWLVEVAEEYKVVPETLHLCVSYIDRFLSRVPVARSKLQLVGVSCMLIAAKFEEIHPPGVDEFVYISDSTYTRAEILAMESTVLNRLQFDLSAATPKAFLQRYVRAAQAACGVDETAASLCSYLCELTLPEYALLAFRPSEVAAAAVRLALHTLRLPPWHASLEHETGYTADALAPCVAELLRVHRAAASNKLQAVREKYSAPRHRSVSLLRPAESPP